MIRNNVITDCAERWYGDPAAIMVFVGADAPAQSIRNITIENNVINCPLTPHGISVKNTDGVKLFGNRITSKDVAVTISDCSNVTADVKYNT